ncbi:hypothetical protein [Leucobacter sp. wl10]|uniref:hypothetical protein n=1 Tax=Leucobacter sp. wl10 TaxID=2304677 RepID=UPI0013C31AC3|nr:hypothetical protein [Leucobacter sp. wl10]
MGHLEQRRGTGRAHAPFARLPAPHGVTLAWAAVPARSAPPATLRTAAEPAGRDRGDGSRARERRAVSRALLRTLLEERIGPAFALQQQCGACGSSAHGPLRVVGAVRGVEVPLVSVSYAHPVPSGDGFPGAAAAEDGIAVVGIAPPGATAFGVDAELDTDGARRAVAEALGTATGIREWTRLEAVSKARGSGLPGAGPDSAAETGPEQRIFDLEFPALSATAVLSVALTPARRAPGRR